MQQRFSLKKQWIFEIFFHKSTFQWLLIAIASHFDSVTLWYNYDGNLKLDTIPIERCTLDAHIFQWMLYIRRYWKCTKRAPEVTRRLIKKAVYLRLLRKVVHCTTTFPFSPTMYVHVYKSWQCLKCLPSPFTLHITCMLTDMYSNPPKPSYTREKSFSV